MASTPLPRHTHHICAGGNLPSTGRRGRRPGRGWAVRPRERRSSQKPGDSPGRSRALAGAPGALTRPPRLFPHITRERRFTVVLGAHLRSPRSMGRDADRQAGAVAAVGLDSLKLFGRQIIFDKILSHMLDIFFSFFNKGGTGRQFNLKCCHLHRER